MLGLNKRSQKQPRTIDAIPFVMLYLILTQHPTPMSQFSFTPRGICAIPRHAPLQQLAVPTQVVFGLGSAIRIDVDCFTRIGVQSARATTLLSLIETAWRRANMQALTAYGALQDPNF